MNKEGFLTELDKYINNIKGENRTGDILLHLNGGSGAIPIRGLVQCRALAFTNNAQVSMLINKKDINLDIVKDWFEIGYKIFKVSNKEKIEIIELDKYYIFYYKFDSAGAPICQWFLFPGYKYFPEFYKLFKQVKEGSTLDDVQACKVVFIIMAAKDNTFRSNFGYKFPFVVEYQNCPMIAGDPNVEGFSNAMVQRSIYSRAVGSEKNGTGILCYDFNIKDKTFEEIYLDNTKWLLGRVLFDRIISLKDMHFNVNLVPFKGAGCLDAFIPGFTKKVEIKIVNSRAYVDLYSIKDLMEKVIKKIKGPIPEYKSFNKETAYLKSEIAKFEK